MGNPNFALTPSVVDLKQYEKSIAISRKHEETYAAFHYIHSFAGAALFCTRQQDNSLRKKRLKPW